MYLGLVIVDLQFRWVEFVFFTHGLLLLVRKISHCIFSKRQAVQVYVKYFEEYEIEGQPSLGDTTTRSNIDISFSNELAKAYPESRPYYC